MKASANYKKMQDSASLSFFEAIRLIIRDSVYGYIFWSIFQGLAPMIWFYPLNDLEISGYEAFAAVWLSPIVCVIPGVLTLLQNKWVLTILRLVSAASVVSFQAPSTLCRLIVLAVGTGVSMLVLAASLWSPVKSVRYRTYWGLIVGLHAFLASRIWFVTFIPAWWDNYSNSIVVSAGVVSALGYILEEHPPPQSKPLEKAQTVGPHWLPCGLGLGSLFYLTHWCFGEVSLISRWTVKGFPNTGPVPLPWGSLVLFGLVAGSLFKKRQATPVLNTLGAAFCFFFILLYPDPYLTYAAGCFLAYLTMALWPVAIDRATQTNPGMCLSLAGLVYVVQVLFWVWTVAYNFVPYGEYTREHTDWLIGIVMAGIFLLTLSGRQSDGNFTPYYEKSEDKAVPSFGQYVKVILLVLLVGQGGMVRRYYSYEPGRVTKADPKTFTAAIWTFHFGYDNRGWPSMERAATLLNNTGADVITLLESDASKPFLGNNDLAMWLAEKLNFYVDFGPSTKDHTWGNLILSRYPFVKSVHHLLPSPEGELAPAVTASINISGILVDFVVTHMGNDRDVLDRKLQTKFLAEELKNSHGPAVFLGYVTSAPGSPNYQTLRKTGQVKDIDPTDMGRWCQYIMYKELIRMGYARISHGGLSDTEIQVATLRIPDDPQNYQDNEQTTISSEDIPKDVLYSDKFGQYRTGHNYAETHRFHMGTPKYFHN